MPCSPRKASGFSPARRRHPGRTRSRRIIGRRLGRVMPIQVSRWRLRLLREGTSPGGSAAWTPSERRTAMRTVVSRDGTRIAFDRCGTGPPVVLVGGAFQHRAFDPGPRSWRGCCRRISRCSTTTAGAAGTAAARRRMRCSARLKTFRPSSRRPAGRGTPRHLMMMTARGALPASSLRVRAARTCSAS